MACNCSSISDGKSIADLVRGKGFENMSPKTNHSIICDCGEVFEMKTLVCKCPNCNMTYAVTPCSSDKIESVNKCGINY